MRLTTFTDYAIRVLLYVAVKGEEKATIGEIAQSYGISKNHLMKVVQELHHRNYLLATRGKNGGLNLRVPPHEINIGRLVRELEKENVMAECFGTGNDCVITPVCGLKSIFANALEAFFETLDAYTLADILPPPRRRQQLLDILDISA